MVLSQSLESFGIRVSSSLKDTHPIPFPLYTCPVNWMRQVSPHLTSRREIHWRDKRLAQDTLHCFSPPLYLHFGENVHVKKKADLVRTASQTNRNQIWADLISLVI